MHKEEASRLFASLGDANRVKIVKMLYHNPSIDLEALGKKMDLPSTELRVHLSILMETGLVTIEDNMYNCNKDLLHALLTFITTKCGCC